MKKFAITVACLAALAGCSSAEAPRFHSLLSGNAPAARDNAAAAFAIEIAPVSVPAAVDQQQWVVRMPDDSLRMLEQEQWVSSLREEFRAALSERLASRWGAIDARTAAPTLPGWRVNVDVSRFESVAAKEVWLAATWSAAPRDGKGAGIACSSSLREPVAGHIAELAAGHRRAVTRLADEIGARLIALTRGETGCGAPAR
jgi:uncharacterized lipoprotein YmbA